jgi:hypothetical protein
MSLHLALKCKVERMIHSINNVICFLLFQASLPVPYQVEALQTTTYVRNVLPTKATHVQCSFTALHGAQLASYEHLKVFGCLCYPNQSATTSHMLAARSSHRVFLGYSSNHKGYRYLDLSNNPIVISRHVVFDKVVFPFAASLPRHLPLIVMISFMSQH